MESVSVRIPLRVVADPNGWQLSKWLVKTGGPVYRKQRVAVLKSINSGAIDHALAPHGGTLSKSFIAEGDTINPSNAPIAEIQFCPHSVVFKGVCAVCGEEAAPAHFAENPSATEGRLPVAYNSELLSVTRAEAETISSATARRLFESKRLSLVLDLDHTLVHATDDVRAGAILHHSPDNVDKSSVVSFTLGPTPDSRMTSLMHLKLRPNLAEFLARVARMFELHIYTMGSRPYADQVARLIDPDKTLFSGRITSREDFAEGFCNQKSIARLFPCDDSMVLIVDDREDVWISKTGQPYMPNLIRAEPYSFWDGLHEAYDRASSTHEMGVCPEAVAPLQNLTSQVVLRVNGNNVSIPAERSQYPSVEGERMQSKVPGLERELKKEGEDINETDGRKFGTTDPGDAVVPMAESTKSDEGSSLHTPNGMRMAANATTCERSIKAQPALENADPSAVEVVGTLDSGGGRTKVYTSGDVVSNETGCANASKETASNAVVGEKQDCARKVETTREESKDSTSGKQAEAIQDIVERSCVAPMRGGNAHQAPDDEVLPDAAPSFSAELRKTVHEWWKADASPRKSRHLLRLAELLEDCHSRFFNSPDAKGMSIDDRPYPSGSSFRAPADVKRILASMRREVLSDCVITFTGVIPIGVDPHTAPEWILAQRLGAKCSAEYVNGYTTHLVASQHRTAATQKCKEALESDSTFVVTTAWLDDSAVTFERQLELPYCVKVDNRFKSPEEHRGWVEEKYEAVAMILRKRDPSLVRGTVAEDWRAAKRQRTDPGRSHDGSGSGDQSPSSSTAAMHILSGDELGAAMEAVFED